MFSLGASLLEMILQRPLTRGGGSEDSDRAEEWQGLRDGRVLSVIDHQSGNEDNAFVRRRQKDLYVFRDLCLDGYSQDAKNALKMVSIE
jgi:hypothetical protein